jgi:hemoglobin-like flavoprotein
MLNHQQEALIQSSYSKLAAQADIAAQMFYRRLFEIDPSLRTVLGEDGRDLQQRFVQGISTVVAVLSFPGVIETLRKRLAAANLEKWRYDAMSEALVYVIARVLDDEYTPAVEEAWMALYAVLVEQLTTNIA